MKIVTKQRSTGRYSVYLNGEDVGMVFKDRAYGKMDMWKSSLTGRRFYDTRKDAIEATIKNLTR